jgi:telomere length regulation protein
MLVAEIVAHRAGKKLNFSDWDGDDTSKPWARELRLLIAARDIDADIDIEDKAEDEKLAPLSSLASAEMFTDGTRQHSDRVKVMPTMPVVLKTSAGYDSDDSLTGYASPSSSRSASPTPSELEEIERDPTLRVGVKKIPRPVYLAQLGELVRSTSGLSGDDSEQDANKIEMALNCGDELIRKKQGYGVELGMSQCRYLVLICVLHGSFSEENAVNLVYGFVGLQDNFELDGFDVKRQGILNALVTCCPRIAAP